MTTKRKTKAATGPRTLTGSSQAKRQAVVLLEVLSGQSGPQEGSRSLGISLNRYYQLETRALQGLIAALEPRPKGRQRTAQGEIAHLRQETTRLGRELSRTQALLRAAHRSLGLPRTKSTNGSRLDGQVKTGKSVKRRRRTTRAQKAIAVLRPSAESAATSAPPASSGAS